MGGNAFAHLKINRMNMDIYNQIKNDIINKLSKYVIIEIAPELPDKLDFGDLDLIYLLKDTKINLVNTIKEIFNPVDIKINGRTISWVYELNELYYQIDCNKCPNETMLEMYKFYFSYSDLGGIIGRIASYYNLKYGFNGLFLHLSEDIVINHNNNLKNITKYNNSYGTVILNSNPRSICEYMDLDYDKYISGFNSNIEIYDWICNSKLFKPDIFVRLNTEHRKRIKVRPFYQKFREYILQSTPVDNAIHSSTRSEINLQLDAIKYFNKIDELNNIIEKICINQERKDKFNGKVLIDLGIEQIKITETIIYLKNQILTHNEQQNLSIEQINNKWINFIDTHTKTEIYEWIKNKLIT